MLFIVQNSYCHNFKIVTGSDGKEEYINTESITKTKSGISYLLERRPINKDKGTLFKKLIDCKNKKWMILEMLEWDHDHKEWKLIAKLANEDIIPVPNSSFVKGSAVWYHMKLVCSFHNDWTYENQGMNGDKYYVDYDRIHRKDNYVFFWRLRNYSKPTALNDTSLKTYIVGDCKEYRYVLMELFYYQKINGKNTISNMTLNPIKKEWQYSDRIMKTILEKICR